MFYGKGDIFTATKGTVNWLTIDGVKMPTPSKYAYVEADFDSSDSKRSETGELIRDVIRTNVHSPEFSWNAITTAQLRQLLQAVNKSTRHDITIFDPNETNFQKTFVGYAQATRKVEALLPRENPNDTLWKLSMTFIEY